MVAHRIDRRDPETKTNRAVRRAPAALHHDVVFPAEIDDVPDDQKITGEPELLDQREFLLELCFHRRADRGVTLLRAEEGDRAQERIHRVAIGHRIIGEIVADDFREKTRGAPPGARCFRSRPADRERALSFRLRSSNGAPHFVRRVARGIEMGVLADAGENVEHLAAVRTGVLHAVRRQQAGADDVPRDRSAAIDAFLAAHEMALNLDINVDRGQTCR